MLNYFVYVCSEPMLVTYACLSVPSHSHVIPILKKNFQCELALSVTTINAYGIRNPMTSKFHCHPKLSVVGIQLPPKIECRWISCATHHALIHYR